MGVTGEWVGLHVRLCGAHLMPQKRRPFDVEHQQVALHALARLLERCNTGADDLAGVHLRVCQVDLAKVLEIVFSYQVSASSLHCAHIQT